MSDLSLLERTDQSFVAEGAVLLGEEDVAKPAEDDERFWSVTTMLKSIANGALDYWGKEQVAKSAVGIRKTLSARVDEDGEEETVKWLINSVYRRPKGQRSSAELGTAVHDAIEQYTITGIYPDVDDEVAPFLMQFDRWAQAFQPVYIAAEMAVYNATYGYAGTLDFILRLDAQASASDPDLNGQLDVIGDYKTSRDSFTKKGEEKKPYAEVGLQLAAYANAELCATWRARRHEYQRRRYYLLSQAERELSRSLPRIDGAIAIHITPDHCRPYPVRIDEPVFDAFLYTVEVTRWNNDLSKTVIGPPLTIGAN